MRAISYSSVVVAPQSDSHPVAPQSATGSGSVPVPATPAAMPVAVAPSAAIPSRASISLLKKFRGALVSAAVLLALLVAGGLYWRAHRSKPLSEKDTIVLADFANSTGDPVFDDTLKTALSVSLNQSPFLNVLPDNNISATLQLMARPANTALTPEVARDLCQRTTSKAYIAGSIASLGNQYVVGLKAVNCQSGDVLAEEQVTAPAKEKVLDAVGEAANKLRGALGESLATVQKFDVPLAQATTSSLEALKAYSLGLKATAEKGVSDSLPYDQRSIELDPNFAMGYWAVGGDYYSLGELGRASEYFTKAFEMRNHASEREKQTITQDYYLNVTGELDRAAQVIQEQIESYPRDPRPYTSLGLALALHGPYDKAADTFRQAIPLDPDHVSLYSNLGNICLALQQFKQTRQTIRDARARKLDDFVLHSQLYALAFLRSDSQDSAGMAKELEWFSAKPEENFGLSMASDTEAYAGRLDKARETHPSRRRFRHPPTARRPGQSGMRTPLSAKRLLATPFTAFAS